MKYRGVLRRLTSTNENLRTSSVEGEFDELPQLGERFALLGKSLTPERTHRFVDTSPAEKFLYEAVGLKVFRTHFSIYELKYGEAV